MARLSRPLNRTALRIADDIFYANHPELVQNGKRIPLSATDPGQAHLHEEWTRLYKTYGGTVENDRDKASVRKPDDLMPSCPVQDQNWIALEYLYCDGTGVAGAHYRVTNNDDGAIVAQGILDGNGYARCALPVAVDNVSYDFDKDPPTIAYLKYPIVNPELPKVRKGWLDRMAADIADAGSWTWGTIQGDFNEDQTVGQVATNAVITMVPIVDQIGDIRDIIANLKLLIWDQRYTDKWVWIALVLTLIGLIPVVGSAAKGVLKVVAKALKEGGKVPLKRLIEVLNKFHKGNAVQWLRKLADDLPNHAATVKSKFRDILNGLRDQLKSLADILPGSLGKQAEEAVNSIDEVAKIADDKIDEAIKELQDGLNKSLDEGVDYTGEGATKNMNSRKQTDQSGVERAAKYGDNWPSASLNDAIAGFAGTNPVVTTTTKGKRIYTNRETGIQVVEDVSGRYFRIYDPNIKGKRRYLDMNGNIPNNKTLENGTQTGRSQSEYNQVTHFRIED